MALVERQVLGVRHALENLSSLKEASFVGRDSYLIFEKFDDLTHVFELIEHLLVMAATLRDGFRGNKNCISLDRAKATSSSSWRSSTSC
jgi:hypothetical protein